MESRLPAVLNKQQQSPTNTQLMTERTDAYSRFRGSLHIAMGVIYLLLGSSVLYMKYFGAIELNAGVAYLLGGMMLLYGFFRLFRGISQMRQRTPDTNRREM